MAVEVRLVLRFEDELDIPDETTVEAEFNCEVVGRQMRDDEGDKWEDV